MKLLYLILIVAVSTVCAKSKSKSKSKTLNVLFIGNSFTIYNDVPKMVQKLAKADGKKLKYDTKLNKGWTLEKHWDSKLTRSKIQKGDWDVVIIQDSSTRPARNDDYVCRKSYKYARYFAREVKKYNPKAVMQWYDTWAWPYGKDNYCPTESAMCKYETMQDRVTKTYEAYACMFQKRYQNGQIAATGEAFRYVKEKHGDKYFYNMFPTKGVSDHHANKKGSYLSALMHYQTLFKRSVSKKGNKYTAGLKKKDVSRLQKAARAVYRSRSWYFDNSTSCSECICRDDCPNVQDSKDCDLSWNTCMDNIDWALGCDFNDNNNTNTLDQVQTTPEDCGKTCIDTPGCTHFAWTDNNNNGTCLMKTGDVTKEDAVCSKEEGIVCGINGNDNMAG